MQLSFRSATSEDLPHILALLQQDRVACEDSKRQTGAIEDAAAIFKWIEQDPNNTLIVGLHRGTIVATCQLTFIPYLSYGASWRLLIESVRVTPTLRRRGVGQQLLEWALEQGRSRGCKIAQLTSNKQRDAAHCFYKSLGFKATHEGYKLWL